MTSEKLVEKVARQLQELSDVDIGATWETIDEGYKNWWRTQAKRILFGNDLALMVKSEKPIVNLLGDDYCSVEYIPLAEALEEKK